MKLEPSAALSHLLNTTRQILPLPEPVWDDFAGIWQPFAAKRKVILTAEGQPEKYLYFVLPLRPMRGPYWLNLSINRSTCSG